MRADPHPPKRVTGEEYPCGPVSKSHANGPKSPLKGFEMERRMVWLRSPELIVLSRELLDLCGQPVKSFPEFWGCFGFHFRGVGNSRAVPSLSDRSASSIIQSSLPASASARICLSHSSSGSGCSNAFNSHRSWNDKLSIAALISSTRLMLKNMAKPAPDVNPVWTAAVRCRFFQSMKIDIESSSISDQLVTMPKARFSHKLSKRQRAALAQNAFHSVPFSC